MKLKDFLIPFTFVLVSTWLVQVLMRSYMGTQAEESATEIKAGQSFVALKKEELIKPLVTAVDFLDADFQCTGDALVIGTDLATVEFAPCGGMIRRYTMKRAHAQELTYLHATEWQQDAFLVALQQETPLAYELVGNNHEAGVHTVSWRAKTATATISKVFRLYDNSYKVDLELGIEPHKAAAVQPRIFIPAPLLSQTSDYIQGLVMSESGTLEKKKPDVIEGRLWVMPELFGAEDRYFITALVKDTDHFVQRAYYRLQGVQQLTAILEGPLLTEAKRWHLSFYCGPKLVSSMAAVDERLESTLDYGWLGPIAKFSMVILNFFYRYVHNYGFAIILLTLLMRLLLVPLTFRAERSAKRAVDMKKKLQYLEQKYKDDPETLAREKAELIKKSGLFDVGCLSIFAQLPLLLALNRALSTSLELYQAPFLWMKDLSAIDSYYVLPAFVGLGMFMQSRSSSDARQGLVTILMALVVAGIMTNLAAGLVLFIGVSTWLSIGQSYLQKSFKV